MSLKYDISDHKTSGYDENANEYTSNSTISDRRHRQTSSPSRMLQTAMPSSDFVDASPRHRAASAFFSAFRRAAASEGFAGEVQGRCGCAADDVAKALLVNAVAGGKRGAL